MILENTFCFYLSTRANFFIFLEILLAPMKKLFMSKKIGGALEKHMSALSWLQGSRNPKEDLDHVPWEHLQIL